MYSLWLIALFILQTYFYFMLMSVFMLTCMYVHCVCAESMGMRKGHGVSEKWSGESTSDHYIFKPIKIPDGSQHGNLPPWWLTVTTQYKWGLSLSTAAAAAFWVSQERKEWKRCTFIATVLITQTLFFYQTVFKETSSRVDDDTPGLRSGPRWSQSYVGPRIKPRTPLRLIKTSI